MAEGGAPEEKRLTLKFKLGGKVVLERKKVEPPPEPIVAEPVVEPKREKRKRSGKTSPDKPKADKKKKSSKRKSKKDVESIAVPEQNEMFTIEEDDLPLEEEEEFEDEETFLQTLEDENQASLPSGKLTARQRALMKREEDGGLEEGDDLVALTDDGDACNG